MSIKRSYFNGAVNIKNFRFIKDNRGQFSKLLESKKNQKILDLYYSVSKKNALRGIHFYEREKKLKKYIYCLNGSFLSIFIDLRKRSLTYGKVEKFLFKGKDTFYVELNSLIGHGMLSLTNNTILVSALNKVYNENNERGFLWNSINFKWPTKAPLLSNKDKKLKKFSEKFKRK